jgi:spore coat protein H
MRVLVALVFAGALLRSGAEGFPGPAVWPVEIEISAERAEGLKKNPREYVAAKVRVFGEDVYEAAVRLKGRGSFEPLDGKPSFTIDFERFGKVVGPHGLTKIHLNNSVEDPSYLKERIGSEMFQSAGIPAPRVGHARVRLNGRMLGLYVMKEGFTKDFLRRHFKNSAGNLYDTDSGNDVDQRLQRELGPEGGEDRDELKRLAAAAKDPDLERRWSRLENALDIERFLAFMATELMICHWDGYCLSRNNFRVYYESGRDKILFLPGGMDQIFSKADMPWNLPMAGLVANAVLETAEGRQRYERKFRSLFEADFDAAKLTNRVVALVAELRPFLSRGELGAIGAEADRLSAKIVEREKSLRKQFAEGAPEIPRFVNGIALLTGWKAVDEPAGGRMEEGASALRIVAGQRTAAAWRRTVRLKPGRYVFSAIARTSAVEPLPFGGRHGAVLRVVGTAWQSAALLGTNGATPLRCRFEVEQEGEVVLACELRASGGEARFEKNPNLEVE